MKSVPRALTHPEDDGDLLQRRMKVYKLRTAQRMSYRKIAVAMKGEPGVPPSYSGPDAWQDMQWVLNDYRKQRVNDLDSYIEDELTLMAHTEERINELLAALWSDAANAGEIGSIIAAQKLLMSLLKVSDQRSKLLGLYKQPEKNGGAAAPEYFVNAGDMSVNIFDNAAVQQFAEQLMVARSGKRIIEHGPVSAS